MLDPKSLLNGAFMFAFFPTINITGKEGNQYETITNISLKVLKRVSKQKKQPCTCNKIQS